MGKMGAKKNIFSNIFKKTGRPFSRNDLLLVKLVLVSVFISTGF